MCTMVLTMSSENKNIIEYKSVKKKDNLGLGHHIKKIILSMYTSVHRSDTVSLVLDIA